ncbi:hypothetical protein BD779DRAFT_1786112 [Infundibulicybe gibba]|nr:hypothetical protein BD779DRAFT_1786112 [Infundibulicybe gibba]
MSAEAQVALLRLGVKNSHTAATRLDARKTTSDPEALKNRSSQLEATETAHLVANRGTQIQSSFIQQDLIIVGPYTSRFPKPLPLGYLLHYPISILVHIFWLASRGGGGDRGILSSLSTISKLFREVCKPLKPLKFTLSRSKQIIEPSSDLEARVEGYRQLVDLPDMAHIQNLQSEYPLRRIARAEQFLYGRPYSGPRPQPEREMCDQETQVEPKDCEVPSWATASQDIIRRPQPPPPGYLLDYPIDLLTRILALVCISRPEAGRSLCLVSKGFYAAVKPVMLSRVRLRRLHQIMWFAHVLSIDPIARVGVRKLDICLTRLEILLLHAERHWDTAENIGCFRWDPNYWGDPDAEYIYELDSSDESEDSYDSGEEMDLEQDMAFLTSPEGQSVGNLQSSGEIKRCPMDVGLEKARNLMDKAMTEIIHTVAPTLQKLELALKDQQLGITLPIFPELTKLTIRVTLLPALKHHPHTLFPALKTLWIQGKLGENRVDLDDLIHHAPAITLIRVPFGRDLLRALTGKLVAFSPPGAPVAGGGRMFECVKMVYVAHDYNDKVNKVFRRDEALCETWDNVTFFGRYDTSDDNASDQVLRRSWFVWVQRRIATQVVAELEIWGVTGNVKSENATSTANQDAPRNSMTEGTPITRLEGVDAVAGLRWSHKVGRRGVVGFGTCQIDGWHKRDRV